MKGSDLMRKNRVISACAIILTVLMLCSACTAVLQGLENKQVRQSTETMLDALIGNDFQTAHSLVRNICTEESFKQSFAQMREFLGNVDTYELKLLSIYANSSVSNGQRVNSVSSAYEMITKNDRIIVSVILDDQVGLNSFYLTPYEKTDYYSTGTLGNMKGSSGLQWALLLLNVVVIGLSVFAIVDCCRQKIKRKALWILLLVLGFFTIGATVSSTGIKLNLNLGWITAYSALVRYGSGTVMLRLMLPLGTIIYFIARRALLKNNTLPAATPENEPVCTEAERITEQQPSQASETDGTESQISSDS